ncbi:EthD domain-containing protein [Hypoxylon argillaceum]|nr:EthD domain-containing protein [Hypoxylon argillaceum]KAI1150148.1 EthD domain-containing protein [Nemania diffusa]
MAYSLLVFLSRKPGTTPEQFKDYYNNSHLPLYRNLVGSRFSVLHTQRYLHRTTAPSDSNTPRNPSTPASVFLGTQADFDYDVVVTIDFKDAEAFQAFYEYVQQPDIAAAVAADEERFLDRSQTRTAVLGEKIEINTL